ncbi:MAG: hypothetical protein AB7M05_13080 [Alphaproteobacteria bacterium]
MEQPKDATEVYYRKANDRQNTVVLGFQASCGGTLYNAEALAIAKCNWVCPEM